MPTLRPLAELAQAPQSLARLRARGAPSIRLSKRRERGRRRLSQSFGAAHEAVARAFRGALNGWLREVAERISARLAATGTPAAIVEELFDPGEFRLSFQGLVTPHLRRGLSAGIVFERSWIESSGQQTEQRLRPLIVQAEGPPPPSFSVELSPEMEAALEKFLKERAVGLWNQVGKTTENQLRKTLLAGIKEGDSFDELQARVSERMKSYSGWQARRVARTETTGAMNSAGQFERDEAGIEHKEWSASGDERTRSSHVIADGQIRKNDEAFEVGGARLMYPADASLGAPGSQTINCRCVSVASFDAP